MATYTQRKEVSISEGPSDTIEVDQTDAGSQSFPYIPETSPERVRQSPTSSTPGQQPLPPRPPPQVSQEEIFQQQVIE